MSSTLIATRQIAKHKVVLGIDWHYADDEKSARRLARALTAKVKGLRTVCVPNADGTWLVGSLPKNPSVSGIAAAPVVAQALGNGIAVLPIDQGVWMLAFSSGCVLPHRDVIVSNPDEQNALLTQWLGDMSGLGHLYGEVGGAIEDAEACWRRIEDTLVSLPATQLRTWRVGGSSAVRVLVLALAFGVVAAGLWVALAPAPRTSRQPAVDMALIEQIRRSNEERMQQQVLRQRFLQAAQDRREDLRARSAGEDIRVLLEGLRAYRAPAPWGKLVQMQCKAEEAGWRCTPTWSLPDYMGRLARKALGEPDGAPATGEFMGSSFFLQRTPGKAQRDWPPLGEKVWGAWLYDEVLRHGWRDAQWEAAAQPVVLSAASFTKDGVVLRDTPDIVLGRSLKLDLRGPLAWWLNPKWIAWLSSGPSEVREVVVRAGQLQAQLVFYQIDAPTGDGK